MGLHIHKKSHQGRQVPANTRLTSMAGSELVTHNKGSIRRTSRGRNPGHKTKEE